MLQKYLKKYNKISFEYFREMQDYITFLNDNFKIWPSYLEVNSDIITPTNNTTVVPFSL